MKTRKRSGISELMAAVITIAVTLIAGAALFGFINGEAANSENKLGVANAADVNFLNERFVIAEVAFAPTSITVYVYNNGNVVNNFVQIEVWQVPRSGLDLVYNSTYVTNLNTGQTCPVTTSLESPLLGDGPSTFSVSVGTVSSITLTLPPASCLPGTSLTPGSTYYVKALGVYGNSGIYAQEFLV